MTTALYRRYRPDTFAEMVGQEHVTGPLQQALRSGRVNHAYLFSGPRGCGKTTSARVLARCLNCAQGPTDTPCGTCASCVDLARGGPGSLDVVEIDAASHGGVDDARDLRERATFAPARDRFKVFILDEAHMVTSQGFNALLKIVEEPPEHVKFIFATTEPDKVIGTIRSRTHHYPFRLVPPDVMTPFLSGLCEAEGIEVGAGVLPLVVRAGGGSFRDALSVLDQLLAGGQTLEYEGALALLGYTSRSLLDDVVAAVSAGDGASAFRVVDQVISTGHEPRRFVEDLLERLRDLIVLAAAGEAAGAALGELPADQLERMQTQARNLGPAELSRAADLVNDALTEMAGATSPRLQLELLVARLLLPAPDDGDLGLAARIDRLERGGGAGADRAGAASAPVPAPAAPAQRPAPASQAAVEAAPRADDDGVRRHPPAAPSPAGTEDLPPTSSEPGPTAAGDASSAPSDGVGLGARGVASPAAPSASAAPGAGGVEPPAPAAGLEPSSPVAHEAADAAAPTGTPAPTGPGTPTSDPEHAPSSPASPAATGAAQVETEVLRRRWPEVLETMAGMRRATWALVSQNAQVGELTATTLHLVFSSAGLATAFRNGSHGEIVQRALHESLGVDVRVEGTLAGAEPAGTGGSAGSPATEGFDGGAHRSGPGTAAAGFTATVERPAGVAGASGSSSPSAASAPGVGSLGAPGTPGSPSTPGSPGTPSTPSTPGSPGAGRTLGAPSLATPPSASSPGRYGAPAGGAAAGSAPTPPPWDTAEPTPPPPATPRSPEEEDESAYERAMSEIDSSDPVLEDTGTVGVPLIAEMLGGTIIDEQVDGPEG